MEQLEFSGAHLGRSFATPHHLVLAAGDAGDISAIQNWVRSLSGAVHGQIFIEIFARIQAESIHLPRHIGLTWICRETSSRGFLPGLGEPRGSRLKQAVEGWLDEWARLPGAQTLQVWAGAASCSIMQRYWRQLSYEFNNNQQDRNTK